ncbi:hypothetical protein S245_037346, partial [Arachis hypogaea]
MQCLTTTTTTSHPSNPSSSPPPPPKIVDGVWKDIILTHSRRDPPHHNQHSFEEMTLEAILSKNAVPAVEGSSSSAAARSRECKQYPIVKIGTKDQSFIDSVTGYEDKVVPSQIQRFVSRNMPWINYHEVSDGGHLFIHYSGILEIETKAQKKENMSRLIYAEFELGTGGFSEANFLAEGGFGSVHRGVLPDGQVVAVKQHKLASSQGDLEFCSEVEVLSCAQHRNVVMLIGFCIEDKRRLLVYEYICNGSLDSHLY